MKQNGPIIIIDDDFDEHEILTYAYEALDYPNELIFFSNPREALEYLNRPDVVPFIVISDINMPSLDGFALRQIVFDSEQLRDKCFPYVFLTNGATPEIIGKAYKLSVQGFFKKQADLDETGIMLGEMIDYWKRCLPPDKI